MKKYLTIEDISKKLHIQIGSARNRICRGDPMPPSLRVGRRRLFPEDEFQVWMDSFLNIDDEKKTDSKGWRL
jgi:hypothetical protein